VFISGFETGEGDQMVRCVECPDLETREITGELFNNGCAAQFCGVLIDKEVPLGSALCIVLKECPKYEERRH
jgi:hypothetical protein